MRYLKTQSQSAEAGMSLLKLLIFSTEHEPIGKFVLTLIFPPPVISEWVILFLQSVDSTLSFYSFNTKESHLVILEEALLHLTFTLIQYFPKQNKTVLTLFHENHSPTDDQWTMTLNQEQQDITLMMMMILLQVLQWLDNVRDDVNRSNEMRLLSWYWC